MIKKLKKANPYFLSKQSIAWVAAFAAIGVITLLISHAATNSYFFEPEDGAATSGITQVVDATASGGKAIKFGAPSSGSGCGLSGEVFCENFEEGPAANASTSRSGDFNANKISASRFGGYDPAGFFGSISAAGPQATGPAAISACRSGSVSNPLPPGDTLICDPTSTINSHYGYTASASQNYGDNSYRINQPLDISGRTGTISFDADLEDPQDLYGWQYMTFSQDPVGIPGTADFNARNSVPANGIAYQFRLTCAPNPHTSSLKIYSYADYRETQITQQSDFDNCTAKPTTSPGHLNHVIIKVSQAHTDVYISDYSTDGVTFSTPKLILSKDISLNFSNGYLIFGGHNHATNKYGSFLSWNVEWDNIAFDGPAIAADRTYQVQDNNILANGMRYIGWYIPESAEPLMTPLSVSNVDKSNMTSAKLSVHLWFLRQAAVAPYDTLRLNYRVNNGSWHSVGFSEGQLWALNTQFPGAGAGIDYNEGSENFVLDVPISELTNGTNTVQFQNIGMSNNGGYKPVLSNVDLLLR